MTEINHFEASTRLFNSANFEEGLQEINKCIQENPHNSVLYSNRSLFLVQLGQVHQALKDLKVSIKLNYLNYVSYFNLFSIHVRQRNFQHALEDLYCALSAIYLVAAKQTKSYDFVSKSVHYSTNNKQARVLKGLMELQQGKFKQAHQQLVYACGIQTGNNVLSKVRDLIKKIGDQNDEKSEQQSSDASKKGQIKRLQASLVITDQLDLEFQIKQKINEFNKIYEIIGVSQGIITQKLGQKVVNPDVFIRQKTAIIHSKDTKIQCLDQKSDLEEIVVEKTEEAAQTLESHPEEIVVEKAQEVVQTLESRPEEVIVQKTQEVVQTLESHPEEVIVQKTQEVVQTLESHPEEIIVEKAQEVVQTLESHPQETVERTQEVVQTLESHPEEIIVEKAQEVVQTLESHPEEIVVQNTQEVVQNLESHPEEVIVQKTQEVVQTLESHPEEVVVQTIPQAFQHQIQQAVLSFFNTQVQQPTNTVEQQMINKLQSVQTQIKEQTLQAQTLKEKVQTEINHVQQTIILKDLNQHDISKTVQQQVIAALKVQEHIVLNSWKQSTKYNDA